MSEPTTPASPPAPPAKRGRTLNPTRTGRTVGSKDLTVSQRAEAVALWRSGDVTLEDLSKRFKKRAETFSRMFKKMGIKKGSAAEETTKRVVAAAEERSVSSVATALERIAKVKDEHFQMSNALARLAYAEIVRARQASLPIAGLKETMVTLKLAGEVIGNARKELWQVLGVEEAEKLKELDELPELTVRELTQSETEQLQTQMETDDIDLGAGSDEGSELSTGPIEGVGDDDELESV